MQLEHGQTPLGRIIKTSRHLFNEEDDYKSGQNTGRDGDNAGGVLRNITNLHTMNQPTANHSGNGSLTSFPLKEPGNFD